MRIDVDVSSLKPGLAERLAGDLLPRQGPATPAVRHVLNALAVAVSLSVGAKGPATVDLDLDDLNADELDSLCRRWLAMAEGFGDRWPAVTELASTLYLVADRERAHRARLSRRPPAIENDNSSW